jgi:autotransporter translocation and assembly factor TamB
MPEFPCSGPITVDLRLGGGSVELHAEPRDTAVVEVAPYDSSDASREAATQTRVELSGDTLMIAGPEASGWLLRRSPRLQVTARVPAGSTGRLRVASADVTGHGEWANVKLNTASGDAYFERVTGDLTVNTASGDVRAVLVGGRLTVKTASGDVTAQQVDGTADITSASGEVQIDESGADVSAKTVSGNTRVGAARQGTVRANTVSGDVSIGVISGTGVWLDLSTLSGKTRSDLDMSGAGSAVVPPDHTLALQVRTVSGDIEVHRATLPAAA